MERRVGRRRSVLGIAVGRCPDGKPWEDLSTSQQLPRDPSARTLLHAHRDPTDRWWRWICVRRVEVLGSTHRVSLDILHELGHLETGHGHDDRWRAWMRRHQLPIHRDYQKVSRG